MPACDPGVIRSSPPGSAWSALATAGYLDDAEAWQSWSRRSWSRNCRSRGNNDVDVHEEIAEVVEAELRRAQESVNQNPKSIFADGVDHGDDRCFAAFDRAAQHEPTRRSDCPTEGEYLADGGVASARLTLRSPITAIAQVYRRPGEWVNGQQALASENDRLRAEGFSAALLPAVQRAVELIVDWGGL